MKLRIFLLAATVAFVLTSCGKDDAPETANNAPKMTNQNASASEDTQPGTSFYTVVASDDDKGDTLEFSISENENGLFTINTNTGALSLASGQSLDFSTSQTHTITVSVTDGTDSTSATITITVTEGEVIVVGAAPVMDNQEFEVGDNVSDTDVLAMIVATDEDTEILEFSINTDNADIFKITTEGELSLKDGAELDAWEAESHELVISVTDGESTTDATIILNVSDKRSFITTWQTNTGGETISFGDIGGVYECNIKWGDETDDSFDTYVGNNAPDHVYQEAGTYTVSVRGSFSRMRMGGNASATKLRSIEQWGTIQWQDFSNAFEDCTNLVYNSTDTPNLNSVNSMVAMFKGASKFNGDLSGWDMSNIENMDSMFDFATSFEGIGLESWQVGSVFNMALMFRFASSFNGQIENWDVGSVKFMNGMFLEAGNFNRSLGGWDLANATNMENMLDNCGMSVNNYDATLLGWESSSNTPSGITFGASGLYYCEGADDHDTLTEVKGWTITDEGTDPNCEL